MQTPEVTKLLEEAKVVAETEAPAPAVEDLAAHDYKMILPDFFTKLEEFSGSKLKRVFGALVEYPFEVQEVSFSYPEERELFLMACKIFDCKHVMMNAVLNMKQTEIDDLMKELDAKKKEQESVAVQS